MTTFQQGHQQAFNQGQAHNSPFAEHKPASGQGDASIDRIFLTPRVLDAAAFTEYAESLKSIVRDIDERTARLSTAGTDTDRLARVLRDASTRLKEKADAGTAIAAKLDKQITTADAVVKRINSTLGDEAQLTKLADEIAAKRNVLYRRTIESSLEPLEERCRQAEQRVSEAEARAAAAEDRLADLAARFESLTSQSETLAKQAKVAIRETETRTREAIRETDARAKRAILDAETKAKEAIENAETRAKEAARAAEAKASAAISEAENAADQASKQATDALEQLQTLAEEIRTAAASDANDIESRLGPVRDILKNAAKILGTPDNPGTLVKAIEDAKENAATLSKLRTESKKSVTRATKARAEIQDVITAAVESLESLEARRKNLCDGIEQDLDSINSEISPMQRATATLGRTLDDLTERTTTLHHQIAEACGLLQAAEGVDSSGIPTLDLGESRIVALQEAAQSVLDQTLTQVEEAAGWLAALAAQNCPPEPVRQKATKLDPPTAED